MRPTCISVSKFYEASSDRCTAIARAASQAPRTPVEEPAWSRCTSLLRPPRLGCHGDSSRPPSHMAWCPPSQLKPAGVQMGGGGAGGACQCACCVCRAMAGNETLAEHYTFSGMHHIFGQHKGAGARGGGVGFGVAYCIACRNAYWEWGGGGVLHNLCKCNRLVDCHPTPADLMRSGRCALCPQ